MKTKLFTEINQENLFTKLFSWESPERYWVQKTKAWYVSYSLFFVLIIGIFALLSELMLIVAVIAFVFLWFIQGAMPPKIIEHTITTLGIKTYEKLFRWDNVKHFWFSEKNNVRLLNLELIDDERRGETKSMALLVNHGEDETIFEVLIKYLDYGEKDEIGYTFLSFVLQGKHLEASEYLHETEPIRTTKRLSP